MRVRLNKTVLADMHPKVRRLVCEWSASYHKAIITVRDQASFYAAEDSRVTLINVVTGVEVKATTAGEFAGWTPLSPTDKIPLEKGVVAVETGFFCGHPFLAIRQGIDKEEGIAERKLLDARLAEFRKLKFKIRIERDRDQPGEHSLSVTHNGDQWSTLSLNGSELDTLTNLLSEYNSTLKSKGTEVMA